MQRVHCYYGQHVVVTAKSRAETMARFVASAQRPGLEPAAGGIALVTVPLSLIMDRRRTGSPSKAGERARSHWAAPRSPFHPEGPMRGSRSAPLLSSSPGALGRGQRDPVSLSGEAGAATPAASMTGAQDGATTVLVLEATSVSPWKPRASTAPERVLRQRLVSTGGTPFAGVWFVGGSSGSVDHRWRGGRSRPGGVGRSYGNARPDTTAALSEPAIGNGVSGTELMTPTRTVVAAERSEVQAPRADRRIRQPGCPKRYRFLSIQ
ncbi:hypothetical protein GCM10029976_066440 [Kribbella albertanoniae]